MSYSGQTTGMKATKVFIVPTDYTAQITLKALVDSGLNAELGIHLIDSPNILTGALNVGDRFRIVQKRGGDLHASGYFPYQEGSVFCVNYKAGQTKTMTVKVETAATEKGQVFIVRIYDNTEATLPNYIESYDFVSVTGAETAAQIAAGILADFNMKKVKQEANGRGDFSRFNMTVSGDTLTVTAIDKATIFGINTQEDLMGAATVTVTQDFIAENGGYDYVKQLEFEGHNFDGYIHASKINRFDKWGDMPTFAEMGCTYDFIYIQPVVREKGMSLPHRENVHLPAIAIACKTEVVGTTGSPAYSSLKILFNL